MTCSFFTSDTFDTSVLFLPSYEICWNLPTLTFVYKNRQRHLLSFVKVNMSSYTYNQSTGKFCNDKSGQCTQSYSGYKGETDQTKKNAGPIPTGDYKVANSCGGAKERCNLTPDASNNMSGRSSFQIHGDNGKGDQSASHGCIILNKNDRAGLKSGDTVHVKKDEK